MKTIKSAMAAAAEKKSAAQKNILLMVENISSGIDVPVMTEEEGKEMKKAAEERKAAAKMAAEKIVEMEKGICEIEKIEGWEEVPLLFHRHRELVAVKKKLESVGDDVFKSSLEVARLIAEINACNNPSERDIDTFFQKVVNMERGRFMGEKEALLFPSKFPRIFFKGRVLASQPSEFYNKEISPADKKIFYELGRVTGRFMDGKKKLRRTKMAELREKGEGDLSGLVLREPGVYRICFSARKDKYNKKWEEGVGLVEVVNLNELGGKPFFVVKTVDGAGSLHWLSVNVGGWIPFPAVFTGRVVEEKTPAKKLEFAKRFARMLNYACRDALSALRAQGQGRE